MVDERTLREVYAYPFARVIEAGIGSIMCSYNRINGTYSCENDATLNKLLKEEMGFQGVVQSDWGATHSTVDSVNHGLDVTMPVSHMHIEEAGFSYNFRAISTWVMVFLTLEKT